MTQTNRSTADLWRRAVLTAAATLLLVVVALALATPPAIADEPPSFSKFEFWSKNGRYLGEVKNESRLIRSKNKSSLRGTKRSKTVDRSPRKVVFLHRREESYC